MSVLVLAIAIVAVVLGLLVADIAIFLGARARAQVAADSAALAAAPLTFRSFGAERDPVVAAERFAAANGASLLSCGCKADHSWRTRTVRVEVEVPVSLLLLSADAVTAVSQAEFAPTRLHLPKRALPGRIRP